MDQVSELIQRLFPSTDGVNFTANQLLTDHISRLHPGLIGKIINRLAQVEDAALTHTRGYDDMVDDLTEILFNDLNYLGYIQHKLSPSRKEALRIGNRIEGLIPWIEANWQLLPAWIIKNEAPGICLRSLKKASRSSAELKNRINENGRIEAYCRRLITDREFFQDETLVPDGLSAML
jgi:hypothetical protein